MRRAPHLCGVLFKNVSVQFSSVAQFVRLFVTPWTAARQASLSITSPEITQTLKLYNPGLMGRKTTQMGGHSTGDLPFLLKTVHVLFLAMPCDCGILVPGQELNPDPQQ